VAIRENIIAICRRFAARQGNLGNVEASPLPYYKLAKITDIDASLVGRSNIAAYSRVEHRRGQG
jgi:hypothetical protein